MRMAVLKKGNVCSAMDGCLTGVEPGQDICSPSPLPLALCLPSPKSSLALSPGGL